MYAVKTGSGGMIYVPSFMAIAVRHLSNITIVNRNNLRGCNGGVTDRRDF
jgi:hypothetical protein